MYCTHADLVDSFPSYSVLIILLFATWLFFKKTELYLWKLPPGPTGVPLLGYAPFVSKAVHKDIQNLNRTYGKVCSLNIASRRIIVVSDFDTAKEILCHPAALSRSPHMYDFVPGNAGFTTMNGKQWVKERRFALQAVRNIGLGKEQWDAIIQEDVTKVVDYISARKGKRTNLRQQLTMSAMCNMVALVMGRKFLNELDDSGKKLLCEANAAVKEEFQNILIAGVFPHLRNFLIKFNIGRFSERKKAIDAFADLVRNEIKKRLSVEDNDDSIDFIKQYAKHVQKDNGSQISDIDPSHVQCLVGNIGVFLSTSDTSMASAQWILYIMAAYPDIQRKVHDEIDNAVGRNRTITWDDRSKLPYTIACLREMFRWVAVVPLFVPRCVSETFEFHGFKILQGSLILANGWSLNRDPKYWDDPNQYRPERFLNTDSGYRTNVEGYGPFSFGKRNCPGERIALTIVYLYFTGIMQKFDIRTPSGEPPDLTPHFSAIFEPKPQDLCFIERP